MYAGPPQVVSASLLAAIVLTTGAALADPTKDECMNSNESAQGHRASGRLRQAENELTVCVAHSCPVPVRNDCSERLNEVQRAMPTVVLAVRNARGDDLTAVRVLMDGTPLAAALGGSAIDVDPGAHTFSFEAKGYAPFQEEVLVREGEKERSVPVVLRPAEQARAEPVPVAPPPGPANAPLQPSASGGETGHGLSTRRWAALAMVGTGVVGAGVGGILGLVAKSQFDTARQEPGVQRHDDSVTAVNTGNAATVVACAGGLLAVAGGVLWLTAPGPRAQLGANAGQVFVKGTFW
jgi:hypothetical protein